MKLLKLSTLALTLCVATNAAAHSRWLLPTHYNLSSDQGEWIMADATASNEVFNVDKGLSIDALRILTPNGKKVKPSSVYKGHRKSVIDYFVKDSGTYKITSNWEGYRTSFKVDDKRRRLSANKLELSELLPKDAKKVQTRHHMARIETYITMNNPTDNFDIEGKMLELQPITHPSDIVEDEQATFKLLFNGKPQKNVEVEITRDGARYRNDPQTLKLKSDSNGLIKFTLDDAGRYLLIAEYEQKAKNSKLADKQSGELFLTFEAQLD